MGDFDACRFDFRLDSKNGLMPSKRKKTERIQPSNYSTLFKCKLCGTLFSCRTSLLEHKLTHTEYRSNRSKYECSVCSGGEKAAKFSRKDQLREHLSRDHKLDDAQVALLVGGRNTAASGARKPRGSNPRKVTELTPQKKSPVKKTSLEGNTVERRDSLDGVAAQVSNPSLPRLEPIRSQGQPTDQLSPGAPNPASSYLYINFPILLSPTSISGTSSGDRSDRLLQAGIPWPNTPPCTPTSTAAPQVNNIETDKVTNSQCGLMISPNELTTTFDLRNSQLRDWLVARTVAAATAAASGESGTVRQSPLLFGFSDSPAGKRELSGSMVLKELAKGLGKNNDEQGALDFSLKARLAPIEVQDDSLRSRPAFSRHQSMDSEVEVADVVDLSWKGVKLSRGSAAVRAAAAQGRTGLVEMERKTDGVRQSSDGTPSNHYRGNAGAQPGVNTCVASSVRTNYEGPCVYAGINAAGMMGGVGAGGVGEGGRGAGAGARAGAGAGAGAGVGYALRTDFVSEERSHQKRPSGESALPTLPRALSSSRTPAMHSSMPQISFRRAKSGLSKMVEKLWKNKIGEMSDKQPEKSDRMMTCGCHPESVRMKDYDVEATALADAQDELLRSHDQLKSFRDSWIELDGIPKCLERGEQDVVQSSMIAYTQETNMDNHSEDIVKVTEEEEEGDYETGWTENDVIDLTTSSSTRRSVTPAQQDDFVPSQPTWNNLDDGGSYWKLRSPSTWVSGSPSRIDSPQEDAPLSVVDALRDCIQARSSSYSPNAAQLRSTDPIFPDVSRSRCQDYLWEHLLTDRQPRTGYGSPASDPGCGGGSSSSVVNPSYLKNRDAVIFESGSHHMTTYSGSSSPLGEQRLSCGYLNCGKTFKEWRHLKVHLTLHTGEKPLSCYLCRYSCRHRSSMNWHMKSKHRLEKSKTSGNRTVYVDAAARSGSTVPHGATESVEIVEEALENVPSPLLDGKQRDRESETCCYPPQQPGTVYLIEPDGEVFLTERKNETLIRELRLSLNILKNTAGPEVRQLPQPEVLSLTGSDVATIQRSVIKDEKPLTVVTDHCLSRVSGLVTPGCTSASFKDRFVEGPELLLKKITPAPGKDPQFYTSLMRMKYTKHPSNARRPRRPVKRKPVPVNRIVDVVAVHRCVTCDRVFDGADALWLHGLSEHEDVVRGGVSNCEWCGFETGNNTELQCHLLSNHGKEMGTFEEDYHQSSTCGHECSTTRTGLNQHLLHQHEDSEVSRQYLSCPDLGCGDIVNQGTVKQHHLHLGPTLPPAGDAGCGPCGASDGEVSLSLSPLGGPPLLTTLGQADERPVTCDYPGCDKSFRELKHLKVHQMQHTDEKPLRCHLCEYSCRQRNSMNWHMKSKHGQDKHVTSDGRTIYI